MTNTDVAAGTGSGVNGVASRLGLHSVPSLDLAVISGPLLMTEIVDASGGISGVVGVVDSGDEAETILGEVSAALAVELGGSAKPAGPVATGPELTAKITVPTSATGWADTTGAVAVVTVESNDRRSAAASSAAGVVGGVAGVGVVGGGLDRLVNVGLEVSVEIGRTRVTLADVLGFDVGSTIELDRAAGAPVDVRVNDTLLAQGEVVLVDDEYAVRITAIVDPASHQQP